MSLKNHLKRSTPTLCAVALVLSCFGLLPQMQAVVPSPDGCYPGFTTAEGCNALQFLGAGLGNTGVGWYSLYSVGDASFNTGVGAGTLVLNTGDSNTAVGAAALLLNTTGGFNTAVGDSTLQANTTGPANTAIGFHALVSNTTGDSNTATGGNTLISNTTGNSNTANGYRALNSSTTGDNNTATGLRALFNNTEGSNNIALGVDAGNGVTTANDVICVGISGANVNGSCFIGNIRGVTTQNNNAIPVLIDAAGQLGTMSSSRRFKTDIKRIDKASESVLALKPVSFRYKIHKDTTPQFGLIAEEVAEVNPDLVIYDADGKPYTVRYEAVNAMLLNEFLKEHKAFVEEQRNMQEQRAIIARLEQQIEVLTAGLQKVNAQLAAASPSRSGLEVSNTAPQVVNNP